MKKCLFLALAILLMSGVAYAISIPQTERGDAGPAVWTVQVYNNSGSSLSAGDLVVWDMGSSTGDNDNYVTTTTTAGTNLVAGVVYPTTIAAADVGTIAVHGVVSVNTTSTQYGKLAESSLLCSSSTAKKADNCGSIQQEANAFGIVTTAVSSNAVNAFLKNLN